MKSVRVATRFMSLKLSTGEVVPRGKVVTVDDEVADQALRSGFLLADAPKVDRVAAIKAAMSNRRVGSDNAGSPEVTKEKKPRGKKVGKPEEPVTVLVATPAVAGAVAPVAPVAEASASAAPEGAPASETAPEVKPAVEAGATEAK